jgi:hypothetical protein
MGLEERLRVIREDFYGVHGAQFIADALDVPRDTWMNYEQGVTIPGIVVLKLIDATGANPRWLLTGKGEKYLDSLR